MFGVEAVICVRLQISGKEVKSPCGAVSLHHCRAVNASMLDVEM